MAKKKILAICGSTRSTSTNESILRFIADEYANTLDVEIYKGIATLPHFNPELDNENVASSVSDFLTKIAHADGVIICTPEYVFSIPGTLKNALEWTVSTTVFSNKPTAFIVASSLGEKAFESLDLILTTIQAKIAARSKLLISGVRTKFDQHGALIDAKTKQQLKALTESLFN